ncbi:MAG: DUF6796 family protein, partial [Thermoanaerobaculia bacterium]
TDSLQIGVGAAPLGLGLLAICAATLLSLADMLLLYSPDGGYGFSSYQPLAEVPRWRLLLGHYLGILLLPAYIPGYWLVLHGLRDAGPWRSWPVFLLGSYTAAIGGAFHGLLALLALIVQHGDADPAASGQLLGLARAFADPLHGLVNGLFVLASLWFAVAVLSGRSRFPRWLAAANPLLLGLLFVAPYFLAPTFLPALLAAPASFNLAHLVFFCLVTAALRRAPTES